MIGYFFKIISRDYITVLARVLFCGRAGDPGVKNDKKKNRNQRRENGKMMCNRRFYVPLPTALEDGKLNDGQGQARAPPKTSNDNGTNIGDHVTGFMVSGNHRRTIGVYKCVL